MAGREPIPIPRRSAILAAGACLAGCIGNDDAEADDGSSRYAGPMVGEVELASDFPVALEDAASGETAAEIHWHGRQAQGEWHYQPLEIPLDGERTFEVTVLDASYEPLDITDGGDYEVSYVPPDADAPIIEGCVDGDELTVGGVAEGRTDFWLEIRGPQGDSWTSPPLRTQVDSSI